MCACICITKEGLDAGWLIGFTVKGLLCYEDKQESEDICILTRDILMSDANDLDRPVSEMSEIGRWERHGVKTDWWLVYAEEKLGCSETFHRY